MKSFSPGKSAPEGRGRALPGFISGDPGGKEARLRIHAVPRASRTEAAGMQGDALRVRVQAPPADGRANDALCEWLAGVLHASRRAVAVVAGASSREKTVLVKGVSAEAAAAAFGPACGRSAE